MFLLSSELLSTSRGSKYVVDSQEDGNEDENKDEDLENNFKYLFILHTYTYMFACVRYCKYNCIYWGKRKQAPL